MGPRAPWAHRDSSQIDTQGEHRAPLCELNEFGSDRGSDNQFGSHVDLGFEFDRGLGGRRQQQLASDFARVSTQALGRHQLDVSDEQRCMPQPRLHCAPKDGPPRCPRAVNSLRRLCRHVVGGRPHRAPRIHRRSWVSACLSSRSQGDGPKPPMDRDLRSSEGSGQPGQGVGDPGDGRRRGTACGQGRRAALQLGEDS